MREPGKYTPVMWDMQEVAKRIEPAIQKCVEQGILPEGWELYIERDVNSPDRIHMRLDRRDRS